jgi:FAD synthase
MVIVLVFYLSVLVATLGVVSSSYLADHPDLQYTPLYAAAALLPSLTFLPPLISIAAVLALVTTMIVTMALASHTVCTCSENGVLPAVLGRTTTNGVPVAATIIITVITAIFAAFPQLTDILINFGALCNVIVVAIVCITVMASRNHQPTLLTDTFRAPGGTALPIITLLVLVASYIPSILQGGWKLWAVTALYYVLGMLLYGKAEAPVMKIAYGVFDGVHQGHQAVLKAHPDVVYVLPPVGKPVLTTNEEKQELLATYAPSHCDIRFVSTIPSGEQDTPISVSPVLYDGQPITSERIKDALKDGRMEDALAMLGHPYTMHGVVVYGKQLGRTVGMPTVNLQCATEKLVPCHGVYGSVTIVDGKRYLGVTSIGLRPTVDDRPDVTIETFLIHFNQELYGQHIALEVVTYLRPITKFPDLAAVRRQVDDDVRLFVSYSIERHLI